MKVYTHDDYVHIDPKTGIEYITTPEADELNTITFIALIFLLAQVLIGTVLYLYR